MATHAEWEATTTALGDLINHYSIQEYIYRFTADGFLLPPSDCSIDWTGLYEDPGFELMSPTQQEVIHLANTLYNGSNVGFDLGRLLESADDATWTRCIDAIVIRRGVDEEIPAGQLISGKFR